MSKPGVVKLEDFPRKMDELAMMIAEHATVLRGKQHFSTQLDAMKVLTAYYAAKNRAPQDSDDGAAIQSMREQLLEPTPEPEAEADPAVPEEDDGATDGERPPDQ